MGTAAFTQIVCEVELGDRGLYRAAGVYTGGGIIYTGDGII